MIYKIRNSIGKARWAFEISRTEGHGIRADEVREYYRQPRGDGGSSCREEAIGGVKRRATRKQSPGRICGCSFLPFPSLAGSVSRSHRLPSPSIPIRPSLPLSFSSTDGLAAFLFQGSRQQSSHYRNKTTRRSAL